MSNCISTQLVGLSLFETRNMELIAQEIQMNFKKVNNKYYSEEIDEYFEENSVKKFDKYKYTYGVKNSKIAVVSIIETDTNLCGVFIEIPENNNFYSKLII